MDYAVQVWAIVTVVMVAGEILSPGMLLLPFGIGAGCAALLAWAGVGNGWQWIAFLTVSSVILVVAQRLKRRS